MFEGVPVEGLIGVGVFIGSIVVLSLIHGVNAAVQNARASRREAARLVDHLSALASDASGGVKQAHGSGLAASPRPVRKRKVVSARKSEQGTSGRQSYGPQGAAHR
ncbi:MAG: hypothetical protein ACFB0Z_07220 [Candidatus Phaeomarinobacter sp.]